MAIHIDNDQGILDIDTNLIEKISQELLTSFSKDKAEVGILFIDNAEIQLLNNQFRDIDAPTDVLSFSQLEGEFPELNPNILGDIVISTERAKEQSGEKGHSEIEEIVFLIIHGMLHLLGYDHVDSEEEAAKMEAKEAELFQKIKDNFLQER